MGERMVGAAQVPQAEAAPARAAVPALTFAWLHERFKVYQQKTKQLPPSKWERRFFWFGLVMAGLGLLNGSVGLPLPPAIKLALAIVFLSGELIGLLTAMAMMLKRELPQYTRAKETHAVEMDADYIHWRSVVEELQQFPADVRRARLRFVEARRQGMTERIGLALGGIQRLGIFPVLIALYLQFRNWEWGDWASAFDVNLVGGLLLWTMLLFYAAGWMLIGLRLRLDAYAVLLGESLLLAKTSD